MSQHNVVDSLVQARWPRPLAVALAKDAALQAFETSLSHGLKYEKQNFHLAIHSADSHEGQAAFLAKRAPHYTGK